MWDTLGQFSIKKRKFQMEFQMEFKRNFNWVFILCFFKWFFKWFFILICRNVGHSGAVFN